MKVKSKINAGALSINHNQAALTVKTKVKAGAVLLNHNQN